MLIYFLDGVKDKQIILDSKTVFDKKKIIKNSFLGHPVFKNKEKFDNLGKVY